MRAYELDEFDQQALGNYDPTEDRLGRLRRSGTNSQTITLRHLNKLKHIRNRRRRELEKKCALVQTMYGNPERRELELEQQERKLETLRGQIGLEIDAAEIDSGHKDRIRDMALSAMRKLKK